MTRPCDFQIEGDVLYVAPWEMSFDLPPLLSSRYLTDTYKLTSTGVITAPPTAPIYMLRNGTISRMYSKYPPHAECGFVMMFGTCAVHCELIDGGRLVRTLVVIDIENGIGYAVGTSLYVDAAGLAEIIAVVAGRQGSERDDNDDDL